MIDIKQALKEIRGAIAVIDFGGQYAHLIASKIRRLGAYSEILLPEDFFKKNIEFYKGIILSGGPASVYEENSPKISLRIFSLGVPILGICYGHQLIVHTLGGFVKQSKVQEYGATSLTLLNSSLLLHGIKQNSTVWMSHADEVQSLPKGFSVVGYTKNCYYAAIENSEKKIFGLQFHPEVYHTEEGNKILKNFIKICNLSDTWNLKSYLENLVQFLKTHLENKKVFFLLSGGVDSTVAYTILSKVLDNEHLFGVLIDTGFLRHREIQIIQETLKKIPIHIYIEDAKEIFFQRLQNVFDPEEKRKIIGELFIEVQKKVLEKFQLNTENWILGQGTIYPDTIESGATKFSHKIKTHHNRAPIIEKLLSKNLVVEPLRDLYKDEVREIGKLLNVPEEIIYKHPFPGPGLAIRCLCSNQQKSDSEVIHNLSSSIRQIADRLSVEIFKLPIYSVGVQGDKRSYSHPAAIVFRSREDFHKHFDWDFLFNLAREIPNQYKFFNRVILHVPNSYQKNFNLTLKESYLTKQRIQLLQEIDDIVYQFLLEKKKYYEIWQFPVILVPLVDSKGKESIVLRPVVSKDAMTADVYRIDLLLLLELSERIYKTDLISNIFYDLTTKPPATIEWE